LVRLGGVRVSGLDDMAAAARTELDRRPNDGSVEDLGAGARAMRVCVWGGALACLGERDKRDADSFLEGGFRFDVQLVR
jgi:hypothetical protein